MTRGLCVLAALSIITLALERNSLSATEYTSSLGRLGAADRKQVKRADDYFRNINTVKSDFYQFNSIDQGSSMGTFQVAKPNKFRFEYLNSPRSLFISNGGVTTYYDMELDEISVLPASKIPLVLLLSGQSGLEDLNSEILGVNYVGDNCVITTRILLDDIEYGVEYVFDRKIENLREIHIVIEEEQKITLRLINTEINSVLDKDVFIFRNPRLHRKRK
ncbi:MAG: outer-membrane lipoprotein carrier protein LolA [Rickettsiales bacterium]|jgi:outer membrane lipoprotein-sorting protein|nr:outer-membrane lipoprotein carrier protein LolA [Rickettsiales bacterium]